VKIPLTLDGGVGAASAIGVVAVLFLPLTGSDKRLVEGFSP